MMFCLNRVTYDKEAKGLVKSLKEFNFEKVIYADSFLYHNKDKVLQLKAQIRNLREK